jgi:hypothetical protein
MKMKKKGKAESSKEDSKESQGTREPNGSETEGR